MAAAHGLDVARPIPPFRAPYAPADEALVASLLAETRRPPDLDARIAARARRYIQAIRDARGGIGGLEDFMHEYSLSTREGLALMALAEALLRVPDAATQDRLIEDKLGQGDWEHAEALESESWLVSATTWALGMTARLVSTAETPEGVIRRLTRRLGQPTVRTAARQAMRLLGHQFVLGETIEGALARAKDRRERGYRHSFDMLGEGARTLADADRYFASYAHAIEAIGQQAGGKPLPDRPGISVKLSALHPRYDARHAGRAVAEVTPRLIELARAAAAHDLNLTVDAEEADRLELSLDVLARVLAEPSLSGWEGFGLAVQAYQKRATSVIDWLDEAARASRRRLMVRLVKGAYWDTEVKRAQERGLSDFPVFTRKPATDLSFIACAARMLRARPRVFPQFATHNAHSAAAIIELAGDRDFEFQRLHGMGEALYAEVHECEGYACRIYAPVGTHKELLAYLVRRLLENGANSSFVNAVSDPDVPIDGLIAPPEAAFADGAPARHAGIVRPKRIFGERPNSRGLEFGHRDSLEALRRGIASVPLPAVRAVPLPPIGPTIERPVVSPADGVTIVGTVAELGPDADVAPFFERAAEGFSAWDETPAETRARALERAADLLEARRDRLMALLCREAGKTLDDGIAEIREAVDFCRFYAAEARRLFARDTVLPGPTGEENRYRLRGRGVFVCISPWNFPLAIFLGQVTAALAAGNAVIAKPAEQTPLVAFEAARVLHEAGVPEDTLLLVFGDGRVGAKLVEARDVAGVAFTGSTEVARRINRALAAKDGPIVPLIAETGGINAMIADATALPEQVTDDVVASAFRSAGQRCSAARLLLVQEDVAEAMIAMIAGAARELTLGDPADPATDIGPVIDEEAKRALLDHVREVTAHGHKLLYAGSAPERGIFVAPHIIELDRPEALTREVFGPILHVARWRAGELDGALESVAATGYGLTFGLHSRMGGRAERVARQLRVGNLYINRNTIGAVVGAQPFGGSGLSGTGPKAGGPTYVQRFALEQVISTDTTAAGGNASLVTMEDG